jgi:hypothetical protein
MFHIVTRYMLNFCPLIASFQVKFPDIIGAISIRLLSQNAITPSIYSRGGNGLKKWLGHS